MSKKVVILGAGLTGLSAAYHLQNGCCVYEQEPQAGGLARSVNSNGFVFDFDGHLLHFRTNYAKRLITRLLRGRLNRHKRNSWVFSRGTYTKYPFQANTFGLPSQVITSCILGMFKAKGSARKGVDLKSWLLENFGEGITKYFLIPYNRKFWTVEPERLIPDWALDYVPKVNLTTVVEGAFSAKTKPLGYNSVFWYPYKGGIEQLPAAFENRINDVRLNYQAAGIDLNKKTIFFKNGHYAAFTHLISTIPLVELRDIIINRIPASVKQAFSRLNYISVFNLNLGIDRENISDKHWIYFPEDKFSFFRVGFPANFSSWVAPAGKSSLYAEISYSKFKPKDKKMTVDNIRQDLIRAGIIKKEDRILTSVVNDIKYAYVLYDHNYRRSVKTIVDFLLSKGVYPAGRFGSWKYMSMEEAILDGRRVGLAVKNT